MLAACIVFAGTFVGLAIFRLAVAIENITERAHAAGVAAPEER
jgi:hypothetical protein